MEPSPSPDRFIWQVGHAIQQRYRGRQHPLLLGCQLALDGLM
jgi:hypothetical protein